MSWAGACSKRSFRSFTSEAGSSSCIAAMLARPTPTERRRMPDHDTIPAHGGTLVDLLAPQAEAEQLAEEAGNHPKVRMSGREQSDLEMLAVGALSPLTGFQSEDDYRSILD